MFWKMLEVLQTFFREDGGRKIVTLLLLSACIVLFILKADYFNITAIIKGYVRQFKKCNGKYDKNAVVVAFIVPFLLAFITVLNQGEDFSGTGQFFSGITLIITILTALFFAVMGMLLDIKMKIKESGKNVTEKQHLNELCWSVYSTDMFEILLCILLLLMCFIEMTGILDFVILHGGIYFLSYMLLINIMILLKRLCVLYNNLLK